MNQLNVVDSSAWIEYLADTERANLYSKVIENSEQLIVPVITIYEVFKKVLRENGEDLAIQIASLMQSGQVVDLDTSLALEAAQFKLPLADSLIYATAVRHDARLWTQDEHFDGLPNVKYFPK